MRYVKRLPLHRRDPASNKFAVEQDGRIVTNTTNSLQMPAGNTSQRPSVGVDGQLRYNIDIGTGGELEAFIDGSWQIIKTNRQATITQQTFNNGNYSNTIFGPLTYDVNITKPQNVMVYVDNVYQIPTTNYTLQLSTIGSPITTATQATIGANINDTEIFLDSTADFNIGNPVIGTNLTGNTIVGVSTASISISPGALGTVTMGEAVSTTFSTGTFIVFTPSEVPTPNKPITTLLGFDGYNPPFEV
jgi:hypothetical protein